MQAHAPHNSHMQAHAPHNSHMQAHAPHNSHMQAHAHNSHMQAHAPHTRTCTYLLTNSHVCICSDPCSVSGSILVSCLRTRQQEHAACLRQQEHAACSRQASVQVLAQNAIAPGSPGKMLDSLFINRVRSRIARYLTLLDSLLRQWTLLHLQG